MLCLPPAPAGGRGSSRAARRGRRWVRGRPPLGWGGAAAEAGAGAKQALANQLAWGAPGEGVRGLGGPCSAAAARQWALPHTQLVLLLSMLIYRICITVRTGAPLKSRCTACCVLVYRRRDTRCQLRQRGLRQALPPPLPGGVAQLRCAALACALPAAGDIAWRLATCSGPVNSVAVCACSLRRQSYPLYNTQADAAPHVPALPPWLPSLPHPSSATDIPACRHKHSAVLQHAVWLLPLLLSAHHSQGGVRPHRISGCTGSGFVPCWLLEQIKLEPPAFRESAVAM